jgi:DNA topoisomerase-1
MADNLVIVESPAKAKTIEKFLGKDYLVKSSYGHVRDLVKNDKGIKIESNFEPVYEISSDKAKVIDELKKLSKKAKVVWLATDEDREGEAISWHLFESLKLDKKQTRRIVFHEITKPAILEAIENPRFIDMKGKLKHSMPFPHLKLLLNFWLTASRCLKRSFRNGSAMKKMQKVFWKS